MFDDLKRDPQALMSRIYDFVGVATDFEPDTRQRFHLNQTAKVDNIAAKVLKQTRSWGGLKNLVPQGMRTMVRETLQKSTRVEKPKLSVEIKAKLAAYYRDEVLELENLIGRDCSHWLDL